VSDNTDWVFRHACGCPFGVVTGRVAPTRSKAWKQLFWTAKERDEAMDSGVTAEHMTHDQYVADVSPKLSWDYRCPHGGSDELLGI
jgi:hypothetical protein